MTASANSRQGLGTSRSRFATVAMITTRFAPSPTGRIHLGHAFSAALGHARARRRRALPAAHRGSRPRPLPPRVRWLDRGGSAWLGLDWDGEPLVQSERTHLYAAALERLKAQDLVYPCFCTRADIAASLSAPHGDAGAPIPEPAAACPTTQSAAPRPRIAGASTAPPRSPAPACPAGPRTTAAASPPPPPTSATRSSPARTLRPAIIWPASSTMPTAA